MKAISLWEPWASCVAIGAKRNETRSTHWDIRGDVAICSAKRPIDDCGAELIEKYGIKELAAGSLGYGCVLCVVYVSGPQPSCNFGEEELTDQEYDLGDYSLGRWVYPTGLLRRLRDPVPVIGRQGLFNLPPDVEAKAMAQL